jgi:hypothetical protein
MERRGERRQDDKDGEVRDRLKDVRTRKKAQLRIGAA